MKEWLNGGGGHSFLPPVFIKRLIYLPFHALKSGEVKMIRIRFSL